MQKLSTRDKIEFYRKNNKEWLIEGRKNFKLEEIGIRIYTGAKTDAIYVAEKVSGKKKVTKISEQENKTSDFTVKGSRGVYFLGTEGLFYKSSGEYKLKKIYDVDGMKSSIIKNEVIILYQEKENVILWLFSGKIKREIKCTEIMFLSNINTSSSKEIMGISQIYSETGPIRILAKEDDLWYTYRMDDGIYPEPFSFEDEEAKKLVKGEPAIAIKVRKNPKVLVSIEEGDENIPKIKSYCMADICEKAIEDKEYYFVSKNREEFVRVMRKKRNKFIEIGQAQKGDYKFVISICDVLLFKARTQEGLTVLSIYGDSIKTKTYPNAIDITKPEFVELLDGENFITLKPEIIYE